MSCHERRNEECGAVGQARSLPRRTDDRVAAETRPRATESPSDRPRSGRSANTLGRGRRPSVYGPEPSFSWRQRARARPFAALTASIGSGIREARHDMKNCRAESCRGAETRI